MLFGEPAVTIVATPWRDTQAEPERIERYSVCFSCQCGPDVQSEPVGRVIVVTFGVLRSKVAFERLKAVRWVVVFRRIMMLMMT